MPPRKVQRTNEPESSMVPNPSSFSNPNFGKYFVERQGKIVIQERGFDPSMTFCKEIWPLKVGVFFPQLVTALCKKIGVLMASTEQSLKPSRSIIGDTLFTQYFELWAKQIKEWNKHQQETIATPASSQRKAKPTAQQEVRKSSHPKLDWMIHWMQELGLIFQEFARQNNIRVPNYTLNMFGSTQPEQEEQAHEREEEGKDEEEEEEEEEGDDEMDFEEDD
ncbi:hypothetical protein Goarm_009925 [Gossypium armourianum]|uniref:Uncharacterized protein n=1 Tax=Gossypium armourianum TaxID=34283 RepID=A0A7J9JUD5_9ROSI|nr:hypothetical protein [Gossypium armourianum]